MTTWVLVMLAAAAFWGLASALAKVVVRLLFRIDDVTSDELVWVAVGFLCMLGLACVAAVVYLGVFPVRRLVLILLVAATLLSVGAYAYSLVGWGQLVAMGRSVRRWLSQPTGSERK